MTATAGQHLDTRAATVALGLWALAGLSVAVWVALAFNPIWWISAGTTAVLMTSGLVLARFSDQRLTGYLLLAAAGAVNIVNLRFWASPENVLAEVAYVGQWAPLPFLALAYLSYPTGLPLTRSMRWFFVWACVWAVVPRTVGALFSEGDPGLPDAGWWSLARVPGLLMAMGWVEAVTVPVLAVWSTALFVGRWREARGTARDLTRLMVVVGIIVSWGVVAREFGWTLFAWGRISRVQWDRIGDVHQLVIVASVLLIAVTTLAAMARRGPLTERLLATAGKPLGLRTVLREELVDPSVEVYFLVDGRWLGADGAPAEPPSGPGADVVTLSRAGGIPTVQVSLDPSDRLDPGRRRVALAASRLVLNAAQLAIERDAYVDELAASRSRIAAGAEAQRRQLERTLHDGIQQVLLATTATLSRAKLARRAGDEAGLGRAIDEAHGQLLEALAELRRLARGIYPAPLAESGLVGGVQSLARRWPEVALNVVPPLNGYADLDSDHASLVYFAVAEGLANAHKHAHGPVTVTLRQDAATVSGEVVDGGPGGADFAPGGGLTGLRDRVQGLGGTLELTSVPGSPTRLVVTLPRH